MPSTRPRSPLFILAPLVAAAWPCAGCAGAPSLGVAGAYFPAWLACALIGVVAALAARVAMVATGVAQVLPLQLLVSAAVGTLCGSAAWAFWTRF